MQPVYRPNVAVILRKPSGKILLGERLGVKGCWQFPQGGVDPGEDYAAAALRELEEEMGISPNLVKIIDHKSNYRYLFPNGRTKYGIYAGQEQTYFRCDFLGSDSDINLDTTHPEFQDYRWLQPTEYKFRWVPRFKRDVYRQVFMDFFSTKRPPTPEGDTDFGDEASETDDDTF